MKPIFSDYNISILFRVWSFFKNSKNHSFKYNNHYRNTSLEHRIIESGNCWSVDLDKQNLTDRDMKIVVKYAIIRNHCKRIRLRDNYITSEGSSILSEGLYNNQTLESFDLRNNQLSDLGVQCLSSAIIHSNIKTLNLESNNITWEGAIYLAQLIKDSRTLMELYLSKNHLADRGVELIANALSDEKINTQEQSNRRVSSFI
jgi:Ran GTPase-activating protein (RanGAP) involved in mRNA processing and transport